MSRVLYYGGGSASFVFQVSFVQVLDVSCKGVDDGIVESFLEGVNCLGGRLELYKHGVSIMGVHSSLFWQLWR